MRCIIILLLFIGSADVYCQCGITQTTKIVDLDNEKADTTNISLLISGAANNNLSSPTQGVCGVQIKFRHPFQKELFIELISPSGKKITLVGGNITAYITFFINWDVLFIPCGDEASPDSGFLPVWENDQDWLIFSTYAGQYYPHNGCLEDFNAGSVNGTWTLRCIDFVDFGVGQILDFNLIFCDEAGITCGPCKLDPGVIGNNDISSCEDDQSLLINIDKIYPVNPVNNVVYQYTNVIFRDSVIYDYSMDTDFRNYPAGSYKVCGLQNAVSQQSILPVIGEKYNEFTLNALFFEQGACSAVSDSCMTINIFEKSEPVLLEEYICEGQNFSINGQNFDSAGIYDVIFEKEGCDSILKLDLRIVSIAPTITSDRDSIGCLNNTNSLQVSNSSNGGLLLFDWFSLDGIIKSDTSSSIINVGSAGTYCVEVEESASAFTCKETVCKQIYTDFETPVISLRADTITCRKDSVDVILSVNASITSNFWASIDGHPFLEQSNGIKVWKAGLYIVTVTANNQCIVIDSILVNEDKFFPTPEIFSDTLTCFNDSVKIIINTAPGGEFSFEWDGVPAIYAQSQNPYVYSAGNYKVTITDDSNGCSENYAATVVDDIVPPIILSLFADTIDCQQIKVNPEVRVNTSILSYQWVGPGLNSTEESPDIVNSGLYNINVTSSINGCSAEQFFMVEKDTIVPLLTLNADSLSCLRDTVIINLVSNKLLASVAWEGPLGFTSEQSEPKVWMPGVYQVRYTGVNGCMGQDQIVIINSFEIPSVVFKSDSLRCNRDTIRVENVSVDGSYVYQWNGPGLLETTVANPRIVEPGLYEVTITNPASGCSTTQMYNVEDDRIYTIPEISVEPLTCKKDSVQIVLENNDIQTIEYTGPGFTSETKSPFVFTEGLYYYTIINNKNCVTYDSIYVVNNDTLPELNFNPPTFGCKMDSIQLIGNSSISGTAYNWKGPNDFEVAGDSVFAYEGGDYILVGIAPNGCTDSMDFVIDYDTLAPVFQILPPDTLTCKENEINLFTNLISEEGSIVWFPGNIVSNNLIVTVSGNYSAFVTGPNQCTSLQTVTVLENKEFPTFMALSTSINCKDITSRLTVVPTSEYKRINWCNTTNPISTPPDVLTFSTSFAGTYCFLMENDAGCITSGSIEVIEDVKKPSILELIQDTIDCFNPSINIGVVLDIDAIEFKWNGPGINDLVTDSLLNVTESGEYYVLVTGNNFCKEDTVITIIENDNSPIFSLFTDTLTCTDGKINIGVNPVSEISNYVWSGPDFSSNSRVPIVFLPGTYVVTVTGSNGCTDVANVEVIEHIEKPIFEISDTILLPCDTSEILLGVTSSEIILKYKWIFPSGVTHTEQNPKTNMPGAYTVQLTGNNGCISEAKPFLLIINKVPPDFSVKTDTITCQDTIAVLIASSAETDVSYYWKSNSGKIFTTPIVSTNESGIFTLVVSNDSQCIDTVLIKVGLDTIKPDINIIKNGEIQCINKEVNLDASQSDRGQEFLGKWTTQDGNILTSPAKYSIDIDQEGSYIFEIANLKNGCLNNEVVTIVKLPQQFTNLTSVTQSPSCEGFNNGSIELTDLNGTGPYEVILNSVNASNRLSFYNLASGNYDFIITDAWGCVLSKSVSLEETADLNISIDREVTIMFGDSILLKPEYTVDPNGIAKLEWFSKGAVICSDCATLMVRPFTNTVYDVVYSLDGDCAQTVSILVRVKNDIQNAIPNIFHPGQGSNNPKFYIPQTRGIEKINYIRIFDRWAENVYQATNLLPGDPTIGWDGTFNGKEVQPGVFVVFIELVLSDGTTWRYQGDVTVLR